MSISDLKDHRQIGQEQDLFVVSSLVGGGLPMFTPKGFIIRKAIENFIRELQAPLEYQEVWVPHMAKADLYKTSGHFDKFPEKFTVSSSVGDEFILKPVNCPHHFEIFDSRPRSYQDLPIAYTEFSTTYRDEQSGELNGLLRVRSISVDDCHIFCREDQVVEQALKVYQTISNFYAKFNFGVKVRISLRDPKNKNRYIGDDPSWERAEKLILEVAKEVKEEQFEGIGEAAIYGPKIDFMIRDALDREWQLATIQVDFNMPERFKLKYTNSEGGETRPVVIHRAIAGSLERFVGILIEQYQGAFPLWLSPVQAVVIPITERHIDYARKVSEELKGKDIRVEVDGRSETMQSKIRDAQLQKVPFMLVVGDREVENKTVAVRTREGEDLGGLKVEELIGKLQDQIESKS